MTLIQPPRTTVGGEEHEQVTVEDIVARLLEDIEELQRRRHHLFSGNGACVKQIVILPEGATPKELKGFDISHLRGTFTLNDADLCQAMAELRRRRYHVQLVEHRQYNVREDKVSYLVYHVDLLESADSR